MGRRGGLGFIVQPSVTYSSWHVLLCLFLLSPSLHSPRGVPAPTHHLCTVPVTLLMQWFWIGCPGWCQSMRKGEQAWRKEPAGGWDTGQEEQLGGSQLGAAQGLGWRQGWKEWVWPTQPWKHRSKPARLVGKDLQHESLFHIIQNGQWSFKNLFIFSPFYKSLCDNTIPWY